MKKTPLSPRNISDVKKTDAQENSSELTVNLEIPSALKSYQQRNILEKINGNFAKVESSKPKIQVLAGLSGVGKTQLAYEFGRKTNAKIIDGRSKESYEKSIDALCDDLFIEKSKSLKDKIEAICTELLKRGSALIIDDVSEEERGLINDFLEAKDTPSIIITSQCQNWEDLVVTEVKGYTSEEAKQYIQSVVSGCSDEDAKKLASLLSYHPLALSHAANYIRQEKIKVTDYVKAYQEDISERKKLLLKKVSEEGKKTVVTTFFLSLEAVKRKNKDAAEILEESTFYNQSHLSFSNIFDIKGSKASEVKKSLTNYSLIEITGLFERFIVHDLVRESIRIILQDEERFEDMLDKVVKNLVKKLKYDQESDQKNRILASDHFITILIDQYQGSGKSLEKGFKKYIEDYINIILYDKKDIGILKKTVDLLLGKDLPVWIFEVFLKRLNDKIESEVKDVQDYSKEVGDKDLIKYYNNKKKQDEVEAKKYYAIGKNLPSKTDDIHKIAGVIISIGKKLLESSDFGELSNSDINVRIGKMLLLQKKYDEAKTYFISAVDEEGDKKKQIQILKDAISFFDEKAPVTIKKELADKALVLIKEFYHDENSEEYKKEAEYFNKVISEGAKNVSGHVSKMSPEKLHESFSRGQEKEKEKKKEKNRAGFNKFFFGKQEKKAKESEESGSELNIGQKRERGSDDEYSSPSPSPKVTKSADELKQASSTSQEDEKMQIDSKPTEEQVAKQTSTLFTLLEKPTHYVYTDVSDTIRNGADLKRKRTEGEYVGSYPIHIAAYRVNHNKKAIEDILKSFTDPKERYDYMTLENDKGMNVLDCLLYKEEWECDINSVRENVKCLLSYLTESEQKEYLETSLRKIEETSAKPYTFLQDIYNQMGEDSYVKMCEQRRKEEVLIQNEYNSGDEALGAFSDIESRKRMVARVSYKEKTDQEGKITSTPTLELIPSEWRLPTAVKDNQGDHVIAYVLLLQSLSYCRGENIKNLPEQLYNLAKQTLPDHEKEFLEKKQQVEKKCKQKRERRKDAINSLALRETKSKEYLSDLEDDLKKSEIEEIARYVEEFADMFIGSINRIEGESFPQSRKVGAISFISEQMQSLVDKSSELQGDNFKDFREKIKKTIGENLKGVSEEDIKTITKKLSAEINGIKIPDKFKKTAKGKDALNEGKITEFLKTITPAKKYHEGYSIDRINEVLGKINKDDNSLSKEDAISLGKLCAQLFDYSKVDKPDIKLGDIIKREDDEYVLYESIPRHMIIMFSAFSRMNSLTTENKKEIYDAFLNQILTLQLWQDHPVIGMDGKETLLNIDILKSKILEFSSVDDSLNFYMKPTNEFPEPKYSGNRKIIEKVESSEKPKSSTIPQKEKSKKVEKSSSSRSLSDSD